jgi:PAS domain S-box-containing protein
MKSIKTKTISAFLAVIGVMIILIALIIVVNLGLTNRYKQINENIVYEQALKDEVWLLVEDGYGGIKTNDYSKYTERLKKILEIENTLNSRFTATAVDKESKVAYRSVRNSLTAVIAVIEETKKDWEEGGELIGTSETFQDAILKFEFVKQNTTDLLLAETKNIAKVTHDIKKIQTFFFLIVGIIVFLVTLILVVFSFVFTKKISGSIIELSETARRISEGDLKISVSGALLERKDEIGSLSKFFALMVNNLKEKIKALEFSGKELDKKVEEISANNRELEKTKTAMVNLLEDANILETSLKKERDRIRTIVSSIGEGIIVVDKKNKITLINQSAEKILEITAAEVLGHDIVKVIPLYSGLERMTLDNHPVAKVLQTGKIFFSSLKDNLYFQLSSGRRFSTIIMAAPILGEKISGVVLMFRDASEEKELDEARTGFISVASHQLRTPLTSMRWFSEMLIDGDAGEINEDQKHFVERIYQGTERMINLVNLLLQIARVEAGRLKIEPVPIDFKNTTQGVISMLRVSLEEKKQKVVIKTDPDPFPVIPMDQEVIWQVIQNLLSNASRYSPAKATISISISQKGEFIEYAVKDTGIGIPKKYQKRIFEEFYRAENALKLVPEGSGLGLYLVRMLVERWGGKIWFESEEGKGTTFYFNIPVQGMKYKEGEVGLGV